MVIQVLLDSLAFRTPKREDKKRTFLRLLLYVNKQTKTCTSPQKKPKTNQKT
jgi:hypothetical protein